jgi:hypothetical protein
MDKKNSPRNGQNIDDILDPTFEKFVSRSKLGSGKALGEKGKKAKQRRELLERHERKANVQDVIAVGNVAAEVGLTAIPMSGTQLRGALLEIVERAGTEAGLADYEKRGKAWIAARKPARDPMMLPVHVTAAVIGTELSEHCRKVLRLRVVPVPRGFNGRLPLAEAVEVGTRFGATVRIQYQGEEHQLVEKGKPDTDLVALIESDFATLDDEPDSGTGGMPAIEAQAAISAPAAAATHSPPELTLARATPEKPVQQDAGQAAARTLGLGGRRPLALPAVHGKTGDK